MAEIRVRLGSENAIKVPATSIVAGGKLSQLSDVDVSNGQINGMILVYNSSILKWQATNEPSFGGLVTINGRLNVNGLLTNIGGAIFDNIKISSNVISSLPGTGDKLYIDPYPDGLSNQGTVIIKGDLQVDGTTTSINSSTVNADSDIINLGDITSARTVMSQVEVGISTIKLDSIIGINTGDIISGSSYLSLSGLSTIASYDTNTNIITIKDSTIGSISTTSQLSIKHYYDTNTDKGISFDYNVGSGVTNSKKGFFGYKDSTGYLTFIPDATITNNVVSGARGIIDVGGIIFSFSNALGISTRGSAYFSPDGRLVSTNTPEIGYASTSNFILTTDNSNVPVWTSTIDGGQY
jgi:hypothetical protein